MALIRQSQDMIVTIYTPSYHFCEYKLGGKKTERERERENDSGGSSSNPDQKALSIQTTMEEFSAQVVDMDLVAC